MFILHRKQKRMINIIQTTIKNILINKIIGNKSSWNNWPKKLNINENIIKDRHLIVNKVAIIHFFLSKKISRE